jgi:hypothetical protein
MKCPKCGKPIPFMWRFTRSATDAWCPACGAREEQERLRQPGMTDSEASPWYYGASDVMLLLFLALSVIGIVLLFAQGASQTNAVIAGLSLFFVLVFVCLAQVGLDAARQIRQIVAWAGRSVSSVRSE